MTGWDEEAKAREERLAVMRSETQRLFDMGPTALGELRRRVNSADPANYRGNRADRRAAKARQRRERRP